MIRVPSAEVDAAPREIEGQLSFGEWFESEADRWIAICQARGCRVVYEGDGWWVVYPPAG